MAVKTEGLKVKYSFLSTLLFLIVASPWTYQVTYKVFGKSVSSPGGCPTSVGLFLHALVFFLGLYLLMSFPADREGLTNSRKASPDDIDPPFPQASSADPKN
jgi:hypothetical protein